MNINKQHFLVGGLVIVVFLIGIALGKGWDFRSNDMNGVMHRMPDGSHMMNNGMSMDDMMKGMMGNLEGKTGDPFDKAFLEEMMIHHEGAVVMAQQVLATSKRPELIKLANDIITAQTGEIKMMGDWKSAWFK